MEKRYVIGVDFGSDSVRAIVVDARRGLTLGSRAVEYPRWKKGLYQHPERSVFRQHPLDYLETLQESITGALACLSAEDRAAVAGIGIDTTGSTLVPVDREGTPLSLLPEFAENENAMFHLWKDHAAFREAEEITQAFSSGGTDFTQFQGDYSAEWFWAKILHTVRVDQDVRRAAYTWVEHSDWMVGELCGRKKPEEVFHGACAAGHKAYWHSVWKGLPDHELLGKLDPDLKKVAERYGQAPQHAFVKAGTLSPEWARKLGLSEEVVVSGSSFDAHAGAVGAGIREKTMICTIGTSAVDMIVARAEELKGKDIRHNCGQAENSILPGYIGVESGQASFGDIFAWYKQLLMWPAHLVEDEDLQHMLAQKLLPELEKAAGKLPDEPFPIATDWFNGRRYPYTDDFQTASLTGLRLGMSAPYIYRALVFGAVCGLRRIVDGFTGQGIALDQVIAVGGISQKSAYIMQMMADILNKDIAVTDELQTCALGAAMYAAVGSGLYTTAQEASEHMAARIVKVYHPDQERHVLYEKHYLRYLEMAE